MVAEFRRRRDAIVLGLNDIPGIRCCMPHGAFYVFPNISGLGVTSRELADKLLYRGCVATLSRDRVRQVRRRFPAPLLRHLPPKSAPPSTASATR